jgi:hypothetical protein
MNRANFYVAAGLALIFTAMAWADPPDQLTLNDLVNHPDRWPDSVTVNRSFQFNGGGSVSSGQTVLFDGFDNGQLLVETTDHTLQFDINSTDCNLVDAANAAWSKLTPAQRALDMTALAADRSLWPEKAKLKAALTLDNNQNVAAGTELPLAGVTANNVSLAMQSQVGGITVDPGNTDVIARARLLILTDPDKRPPRVADALSPLLIDSTGQKHVDDHLADKKYFLLYFGGKRCPRCVQISPQLVTIVTLLQPAHPELQVVLMSEDDQGDQLGTTLQYMKDEQMPWPAVTWDTMGQNCPGFVTYTQDSGLLPEFVLVDRYGNVKADSDDHHGHYDPEAFINNLPKTLDNLNGKGNN